jgi:hypothetical protein
MCLVTTVATLRKIVCIFKNHVEISQTILPLFAHLELLEILQWVEHEVVAQLFRLVIIIFGQIFAS